MRNRTCEIGNAGKFQTSSKGHVVTAAAAVLVVFVSPCCFGECASKFKKFNTFPLKTAGRLIKFDSGVDGGTVMTGL